ncbi:MAG: fatty acid desaturase [Kangiellaceae bacterium]|jgi:fatty acid desaturase|nr:fatty acid desaturase [Kangiellaceae bacterium]
MQSPQASHNSSFESVWQNYVPSVAWGTLLLGVAVVVGYYLTISSALSGSMPYPIATLLCSYLAYASFTVMHDAGHGSLIEGGSRLKPLESVIGWLSSIPLLIAPYRLFQKIHDRHHAFTNDPDRDPDHYLLTGSWLGIILNSLYIPLQYHIQALTKLRHIKTIRDTYSSSAWYFVFIIAGLTMLVQAGFGREVIYFALIPNVIAVFVLAMFFDYLPHHPHKSRDRFHDTRIYPGRVLNAVLLGQNYHLIHHMYPKLPWYQYKKVFEQIRPEL